MALTTSGLDWKRILAFGVIIAFALILLHVLLYATGSLESIWGPVKSMLAQYFVMVVLGFVAVSYMKKKREAPFAFFDIFIHVLAIAMIILIIYTAYDFLFTKQVDPDLNARITELQIAEAEATLEEAREMEAVGDTIHSEASKEQMEVLIKEGSKTVKDLRANPSTFIDLLSGNIRFFMLFFGLIWGIILSVIHREKVIQN